MIAARFHWGVILITALALLIRVTYLTGTTVEEPIAGDINDYVHYAWNLGQHGVYSSAPIDTSRPVADSFRPPGYPLFLLLAMWLADFGSSWLAVAQGIQILASAGTVLLVMLIGTHWMKPGFALSAGFLLALWPHHVVFASTLLSETLLGFFVMLAIWLATLAERNSSPTLAVSAGVAFGYAALVNTLVVLFPVAIFWLLVLARQRTNAIVLLIAFAALPGAWWVVGPENPLGTLNSTDRATINFVQGSWPQYHLAWQSRADNEISQQILSAINEEVDTMRVDRPAGLRSMGQRMLHEPGRYTRWYLLEKPWLLWDWNIRLGWRGVHFLRTTNSPFEHHYIQRGIYAALKLSNPFIFAFAGLAIVATAVDAVRRRRQVFPAAAIAFFVVYVTFLHVLLQAEPRYSIAYRPAQILLAATGAKIVFGWISTTLQRRL